MGPLLENGIYAATNFSSLFHQHGPLCAALKGIGMESALIMQVDRRRPECGFLVVCPEGHTMRLWQDEEIAAVYVLGLMLSHHFEKE